MYGLGDFTRELVEQHVDPKNHRPSTYLIRFEFFWGLATGYTIFPPLGPDRPEFVVPSQAYVNLAALGLPIGFQTIIAQRQLSFVTIEAIKRLHGRKTSGTRIPITTPFLPVRALSPLRHSRAESQSLDTLLFEALILYSAIFCGQLHAEDSMMLWSGMIQWVRQDLTTRLMSNCHTQMVDWRDCLYWIWRVLMAAWQKKDLSTCKEAKMLKLGIQERFSRDEIDYGAASAHHRFFPLIPPCC
jgi:hypothetical protein